MNIPFLSIFLALNLVYLPKLVMARGQAARPEGYDNALPRDQQAKLDGVGKRAVAAHQNGFEGFAPFACGVICAHLAQVQASTLNALCLAYVAARVIYVGLYLGDLSTLRSVVWTAGFLVTVALYVLAFL
jgi:uncharacterized MAPEG superfamily protein